MCTCFAHAHETLYVEISSMCSTVLLGMFCERHRKLVSAQWTCFVERPQYRVEQSSVPNSLKMHCLFYVASTMHFENALADSMQAQIVSVCAMSNKTQYIYQHSQCKSYVQRGAHSNHVLYSVPLRGTKCLKEKISRTT